MVEAHVKQDGQNDSDLRRRLQAYRLGRTSAPPIGERSRSSRSQAVGTVFPGAACVVALVDRFAQHCHVVDIDADSWRQKHALTREPRDPSDPNRPHPRPKRRRG
jgi:hypothetical protein